MNLSRSVRRDWIIFDDFHYFMNILLLLFILFAQSQPPHLYECSGIITHFFFRSELRGMKFLNILLVCCFLLIPEAMSVGMNNHCPLEIVSRTCTKGRGDRIFNRYTIPSRQLYFFILSAVDQCGILIQSS